MTSTEASRRYRVRFPARPTGPAGDFDAGWWGDAYAVETLHHGDDRAVDRQGYRRPAAVVLQRRFKWRRRFWLIFVAICGCAARAWCTVYVAGAVMFAAGSLIWRAGAIHAGRTCRPRRLWVRRGALAALSPMPSSASSIRNRSGVRPPTLYAAIWGVSTLLGPSLGGPFSDGSRLAACLHADCARRCHHGAARLRLLLPAATDGPRCRQDTGAADRAADRRRDTGQPCRHGRGKTRTKALLIRC